MSNDELRRLRFNGLVDEIEFYLYKIADGFKLSVVQKKKLAELRDTICAFGEVGEMYAKECDNVLKAA